jgi:nucleoside-diphosphate-sugar epimerase
MSDLSNILVTGGTGLVGRALVRKLVAAGQSVRVLSRNANLAEHDGVSTCRGDITDLQDLRVAIQGCSAVFHCAGETIDAGKMTESNVFATRLLFNVAIDAQVKFFCHLSSVGVVGKTRQAIVDEFAPCNPMNLYEETKLAAEGIVSEGLGGGNVVILRPTNIFGVQTLRPWLEKSLSSRARLLVNGKEHAHLVYVEDVAAAAAFLWQAASVNAVDTFNVACDEDTGGTRREVQALLASTVGATASPLALSAPLFFPYWLRKLRNGNSNYGNVIYSSRKLQRAGFQFPFGLRAGLIHAAGALTIRIPRLGARG